MAVELIGGQSHGKYCTGALLGPENIYSKFPSVIKNWGLYVMINRYADKDGNNPCMPDEFKSRIIRLRIIRLTVISWVTRMNLC